MYYVIENASEGIGKEYPQIQKMSDGYDYDASNSVHKLRYNYFPSFEPNFYTAIVENDALLTDFISCSPIPFCLIVSERFKELLTTLSLPEHKYYELPLSHKGRDVDSYWALQILTPNSIGSMINFDKSNFFLKDLRTNKREKLELSSELELQKIKNNLLPMQDFYCTSYTFKDGYLGQYDLFHHGWFDVDYYISELARKKILDMELSGVKIKESRMLKFNQRHNQPLQQMPSE